MSTRDVEGCCQPHVASHVSGSLRTYLLYTLGPLGAQSQFDCVAQRGRGRICGAGDTRAGLQNNLLNCSIEGSGTSLQLRIAVGLSAASGVGSAFRSTNEVR